MGGHAGCWFNSFIRKLSLSTRGDKVCNEQRPTNRNRLWCRYHTWFQNETKRRFTREDKKRKTDSDSDVRDESRHGESNRARNIDTWSWRGTTERTRQSGYDKKDERPQHTQVGRATATHADALLNGQSGCTCGYHPFWSVITLYILALFDESLA